MTATPRPWKYRKLPGGVYQVYAVIPNNFEVELPLDEEDATYLVEAVNAYDALCAENARLRSLCERAIHESARVNPGFARDIEAALAVAKGRDMP